MMHSAIKPCSGGLPAGIPDVELETLFQPFGAVICAWVLASACSGHYLGPGLAEMPRESGTRALTQLNDQETEGLMLGVKKAKAIL